MNGETALIYARTRHPDNDFKRMGRQQNLINSARAALFDDEMIVMFPLLLKRFNEIIETDLTLAEQLILMRDLYLLNDVPVNARVIEPPLVYNYVTEGGAQVLLPNWELVRPLLEEMFGNTD